MRHPVRSTLLALLLTIPAIPAAAVTPNGRLQIIHLDVGQGDGAVLISPLGEVAMFDNGTPGTGVSGRTVVQQLQALGVTRVDHHFVSHYHSDHIANINEIVNAGIVISNAWDRGGSYSGSYYTTYAGTIAAVRHSLVRDQVITLDSSSAHPVTITCVNLNGAGISTTDENSLGVILKVSYGEFDEVFGGDIAGANSGDYKNIESTVGPQVGPVEVYKVHHHGSATSSYTAWLNATQPKIAVISVGTDNSYGHPTAAALTRLHNAGVHTYWTETGSGASPNATWDKVSNGQVIISATWTGAGVDTVRGVGFTSTFTNSGTAGDLTAPVVAVSAPNGSETWAAGSAHNITWTATDNVAVTAISLAYSTNNGAAWTSLATGEANDGSYTWTLPALTTSQALVRVTAYDAAGNSTADPGNEVFTIADQTAPAVAVTSPNGGESWVAGSAHTITWTASDNIAVSSLNILYSTTGGASWTTLATGEANDGSYSWTVPGTQTAEALVRIRVYDSAGNTAIDLSDEVFTVAGQTGVPDLPLLAGRPVLLQNTPNPFNPVTRIGFGLPEPGHTRITIFSIDGRLVRRLVDGDFDAGYHDTGWDGLDETGGPAPSGLYFYRLETGGAIQTKRMILSR